MKDDISNIYEFFSHNFRTFTATIVASVEVLKLDLSSVDELDIASIYESGYLMDIYDNAFNLCLKYALGKPGNSVKSDFSPGVTINKFVSEFEDFINLKGINVDFRDLAEKKFSGDEFVYKNIVQVVLYEIIRVSETDVSIVTKDDRIVIKYDTISEELPVIFEIFPKLLKKYDITFTKNDKSFILEFV